MNDEKKFVKPTADIVEFANEDIVTVSTNETEGWTKDGYVEEW